MMAASPAKASDLPFVSVIVPVYNDRHRIARCLTALAKQSYPRDRYEVIVVDNASTDGTPEIVKKFPVKLLVEEQTQSSYAARNRGIAEAGGEVLAFTDSDAMADCKWLERGVAPIVDGSADYVACDIRMFIEGDRPNWLDMLELCVVFDVEHSVRTQRAGPTAGILVQSSVLEKIGLFDERLTSGGDMEFGRRIYEAGFRQRFASDSIVYHPTRPGMRGFLARSYRYGKGRIDLSRLYPERYGTPGRTLLTQRHFLPPSPGTTFARLDKRPLLHPHKESELRMRRPGLTSKIAVYKLYYAHKLAFYAGMLLHAVFPGRR